MGDSKVGEESFPLTAQQCLRLISEVESEDHQKVEFKVHPDLAETWPLNKEERKVDARLHKEFPSLDIDQRHNLIRGYERFTVEELIQAAGDIDYWNTKFGNDLLYAPATKKDRMFHEAFMEVFHGTDKFGHPVSSLDFSTFDSNKLAELLKEPEMLVRIQSRKLLASAYLKYRLSKCAGRRIRKNIFIMNLDGLSLFKFYRHKDIVKGVMDVGLKYFPETLLKVYLVNPSRVFYMVWNIAKYWLDPVTLSNIHVVKDEKAALAMWREDGIMIETLPKKLGGTGRGSFNISKIVNKIITTGAEDARIQKAKVSVREVPVQVPSKPVPTDIQTLKSADRPKEPSDRLRRNSTHATSTSGSGSKEPKRKRIQNRGELERGLSPTNSPDAFDHSARGNLRPRSERVPPTVSSESFSSTTNLLDSPPRASTCEQKDRVFNAANRRFSTPARVEGDINGQDSGFIMISGTSTFSICNRSMRVSELQDRNSAMEISVHSRRSELSLRPAKSARDRDIFERERRNIKTPVGARSIFDDES
mmetsp:Transcript_11829/g.29159  ORF Transcript_11829/g.29159 Transcript_11829/m.29159 type:complete len:533 (-) Transcript_11829:202-1800(-)